MSPRPRMHGFTLVPVMLTMGLIGAISFTLNRDNGFNANGVASQMDLDRARYAAEAGLQAVNAQVQSAGCAGTFPVAASPVVNSAFNGAAYSAYATASTGNTTGLVSTGSFNGTSVTVTRANAYVYQAAAKTYTLQPGPAAGLDTSVDSTSETNAGALNQLPIKKDRQNLLFKFDLSAFPAGSRPVSATLAFYASGGLLGGVDFYRMTSVWVEGTGALSPLDGATWNTIDGSMAWTPGGAFHAAKLNATTRIYGPSSWVTFDATDVATAWLEGRYPNQGVLIKSTGELGSFTFASSDHSDATQRPKITFNYLVPCGATGPEDIPSGTVTLDATADSFNDSGAAVANNGAVTNLKVYYTPARESRIPISFNVSTVPAGAVIKSAVLRLYVNGTTSATAGTKSVWVNPIAESWAEGAGSNTNKSCPAATAGTSWNYRTNCTGWSTVHPPDSAQSWTAMTAMPTARTGHVVAVVNNKLYAIGGSNSSGYLNVVEEYNPATNSWATKASMPTRRAEAGAAVVNGKIYVIGGSNGAAQNKTEEYDPATNVWTSKAAMSGGRMNLSAVAAGGRIYAIGGATSSTGAAVKTNEEYDPVANTWRSRAAMLTARMWFAGQAVGGKVYALGGYTGSAGLANTEAYDPSSNSWTAKAALPTATDSMGSTALGNRIYLFGGFEGASTVNTVTVYDTVNNAFKRRLNYPVAVNEPAAGVANERIFVMGGDTTTGTYYANHYAFDPGYATPLAMAAEESSATSPLPAGFRAGWITFDLTALVQEWVDGVRPNNGLVIYGEGADQLSINSRESNNKTPQLVVSY